jgi:hypothetical protein
LSYGGEGLLEAFDRMPDAVRNPALTMTIIGLFATALVLRHTTGEAATWAAAGPLLVAGIGGGMVTSPNMTLTLANVPVQMGGAAGGAVQTAQRIGTAVGTATLATIYYHVLTRSGDDFSTAVSDSLISASGFMLVALLMALTGATRRRFSHRAAPEPQRELHCQSDFSMKSWHIAHS